MSLRDSHQQRLVLDVLSERIAPSDIPYAPPPVDPVVGQQYPEPVPPGESNPIPAPPPPIGNNAPVLSDLSSANSTANAVVIEGFVTDENPEFVTIVATASDGTSGFGVPLANGQFGLSFPRLSQGALTVTVAATDQHGVVSESVIVLVNPE